MRRWLPLLGILLGAFIALYALFYADSDEELIRARLEQLEEVVRVSPGENVMVRTAQLKGVFKELFSKQVTFEIPELSRPASGRLKLVQLAGRAPQMWRSADLDLGDLEIKVDEASLSAVAFGPAHLLGKRHSGHQQRDDRIVSLRFDKIEDNWLMVSLEVSERQAAAGPKR